MKPIIANPGERCASFATNGAVVAAKARALAPTPSHSQPSGVHKTPSRAIIASPSMAASKTICTLSTCGVWLSCTMRSGCQRISSAFQKPI